MAKRGDYTMSEDYRRSGCAGKTGFTSAHKARQIAKRTRGGRHKKEVEVYRCQFCGLFHIGGVAPRWARPPKRRKKRT